MRRLLIINNIPTPYRTFMFQKLHDVGLMHGIETTVAYQAEREEQRVWKAEDFRLNVPHFYSSGLRFWSRRPRKFFTYPTINLDILRRSCSGQYDWILYGALNSMNGWLVSWLPAGRSIKIIWSESNLHSTRYMSGWARVLKSRVLAGCHALACPGERALEYIYAFRPQARALPVLLLPNLVDLSVFERTVSELRGRRAAIRAELGIAPHEQFFLGMGRMVDYKGFGQVLEATAHVPGDYKIIFLGDGERLAAWRARVGRAESLAAHPLRRTETGVRSGPASGGRRLVSASGPGGSVTVGDDRSGDRRAACGCGQPDRERAGDGNAQRERLSL